MKGRQLKISSFKSQIRDSRSHRAFTLVEVLLTFALLVIISGLTWVSLQSPWPAAVASAVDAVRSQWCQARVDAMKSGHTYAFRYMVHGDRYHLGPQEDPSVAGCLRPPGRTASAAADEDKLGDDPLPPPVDKTLPGDRFPAGREAATLAAMAMSRDRSGGQKRWLVRSDLFLCRRFHLGCTAVAGRRSTCGDAIDVAGSPVRSPWTT